MSGPRSIYLTAGGYEIHVTEWGDPANPPLVMWHGLARTGRDFDEAAEALSESYFVLCPDTLGRGLSAWARDRDNDYSFEVYCASAVDILDHYGIGSVRWVGTSMGGLIGVTLAGGVLRERISHLVLNDVGPEIPEAATARIVEYVGNPPQFETMAELEDWYRAAYRPFGPNSDAFWRRLCESSARRTDQGKLTVHYDPAIVSQFTAHKSDLDVWGAYDAISAQTLLLRGSQSDVLPLPLAQEMQRRGPKPGLVAFEGFGHAPTLANDEQIGVLRTFLGS